MKIKSFSKFRKLDPETFTDMMIQISDILTFFEDDYEVIFGMTVKLDIERKNKSYNSPMGKYTFKRDGNNFTKAYSELTYSSASYKDVVEKLDNKVSLIDFLSLVDNEKLCVIGCLLIIDIDDSDGAPILVSVESKILSEVDARISSEFEFLEPEKLRDCLRYLIFRD